MRKSKPTVSILVSLFLTIALIVSSSGLSWADPSPSLMINETTSGDRGTKLTVTGDRIPINFEKTYTIQELIQKYGNNGQPNVYNIASVNSFGTADLYTIKGISITQLVADSGFPESAYGITDYFSFVSYDGFMGTYGPGLSYGSYGELKQYGPITEKRYTFPNTNYYFYNLHSFNQTSVPDQTGNNSQGTEIPLIAGFNETKNSANFNENYPAPSSSTNYTSMRSYLGLRDLDDCNQQLFAKYLYKVQFMSKEAYDSKKYSGIRSDAFNVNATVLARADVISGMEDRGVRVKGQFSDESGTTFFVGTTLGSLLNSIKPAVSGNAYIKTASGDLVGYTYDQLINGGYVIAYESGATADNTQAIDREIGGKHYYFDIYKDGAPVIKNVSGIYTSTPNLSCPSTQIIKQDLAITFPDFPTWREAITSISLNSVPLTSADYYLNKGKIIIKGRVLTTEGDVAIKAVAAGFPDATANTTLVTPDAGTVAWNWIDRLNASLNPGDKALVENAATNWEALTATDWFALLDPLQTDKALDKTAVNGLSPESILAAVQGLTAVEFADISLRNNTLADFKSDNEFKVNSLFGISTDELLDLIISKYTENIDAIIDPATGALSKERYSKDSFDKIIASNPILAASLADLGWSKELLNQFETNFFAAINLDAEAQDALILAMMRQNIYMTGELAPLFEAGAPGSDSASGLISLPSTDVYDLKFMLGDINLNSNPNFAIHSSNEGAIKITPEGKLVTGTYNNGNTIITIYLKDGNVTDDWLLKVKIYAQFH